MDIKDRTIVEQALEIQRLKEVISQLRQEIADKWTKENAIEAERKQLTKGNSVA